MGIFDNIGKGKPGRGPDGRVGKAPAVTPGGAASTRPAAAASATGGQRARPGAIATTRTSGSKLPGKRRRKGTGASPRERIATAAAPLHDRRRRLVGAREATLRDLGGLMLEMYKRNRFREELLLDKCEEVLAVEVEIAHVDQRLFQLAPTNAAGMRPIGRCECDAPIYPGQNFCGVCGRSFATLTQSRACARCGGGLRRGDQFCSTCGTEAPDVLQVIEPPSGRPRSATPPIDATSIASSAVAETVVIDTPSLTPDPPPGTPATQPVQEPIAVPFAAAPPQPAPASEPTADTHTAVIDVAPAIDPEPFENLSPFAAAPEPFVLPTQPAPVTPERETGFSWAIEPEPIPDAAMDAALDALPPHPTDPDVPFAGFPQSSTAPPPAAIQVDVAAPIAAPPTSSVSPDRSARFGRLGTLAKSSRLPRPSEAAGPDAPPGVVDDEVAAAAGAKAAAQAEAKALARVRKQAAKDARARAKEQAKAARDAHKRGGGGA